MEQEEYKKEKIKWENVQFSDNLDCIDLIEGQKSASIFRILDEVCMINGNDESLVKKMHDQLQNSKYYERPKNLKTPTTKFIINHYAGKVEYLAESFVDKNKDTVNDIISEVLKTSRKELVKKLFEEQKVQIDSSVKPPNPSNMMAKFNGRNSTGGQTGGPNSSLKGNTISN
jgi:myosin heavy subunit